MSWQIPDLEDPKEKIPIKLRYKRAWGNDRFYPVNSVAERICNLMSQNCFSESQVKDMIAYKFDVDIEYPKRCKYRITSS